MRLAMLSDLHANRQALSACLSHAQSQRVDRFAFLGDLVGYGADPAWVLEQVMVLHAQGAWVLQGNHDAMAAAPPVSDASMGASSAMWTHDRLSVLQRDFLAGLPLSARLDHLLLVHASADHPASWRYVNDESAAGRCLAQALAQAAEG